MLQDHVAGSRRMVISDLAAHVCWLCLRGHASGSCEGIMQEVHLGKSCRSVPSHLKFCVELDDFKTYSLKVRWSHPQDCTKTECHSSGDCITTLHEFSCTRYRYDLCARRDCSPSKTLSILKQSPEMFDSLINRMMCMHEHSS